jgi:hypothetical protein
LSSSSSSNTNHSLFKRTESPAETDIDINIDEDEDSCFHETSHVHHLERSRQKEHGLRPSLTDSSLVSQKRSFPRTWPSSPENPCQDSRTTSSTIKSGHLAFSR